MRKKKKIEEFHLRIYYPKLTKKEKIVFKIYILKRRVVSKSTWGMETIQH